MIKREKRLGITLAMMLVILATLTTGIKPKADEIDIDDFPIVYEVFCQEVADQYDLSEALIISVIWQESRFEANEVKGNVAQITNTIWFSEGITETDSDEPKTDVYENINIMGYYFHKWAEEYPGEPYLWCRMWNEGYENALLNPDYISCYARQVVDRIPDIEEQLNERMEKNNGRLYGQAVSSYFPSNSNGMVKGK